MTDEEILEALRAIYVLPKPQTVRVTYSYRHQGLRFDVNIFYPILRSVSVDGKNHNWYEASAILTDERLARPDEPYNTLVKLTNLFL